MNVQDALNITAELAQGADSATGHITEVHQGLAEIEATLAELLGSDNEEVGKLGAATAQAETTIGVLVQGKQELENLQNILASIL